MESIPRHQCLIYDGAPSLHLPIMARVTRAKLLDNFRCLYLNNRAMVAGMQMYLAAEGVDVEDQVRRGNLVLTSERQHLVDGLFDGQRMLHTLENALQSALADGYAGLWATGDMTWEMGTEKNFAKLLEYERCVEAFFESHANIGGVCQYSRDSLPRNTVRDAVATHRGFFLNENRSIMNPHYVHPHASAEAAPELDSPVNGFWSQAHSV